MSADCRYIRYNTIRTYSGTIPHRLIKILVVDFVVDFNLSIVQLDVDQTGAAFAEGCWHVVRKQVGTVAFLRLSEAEAPDAFAL